MIVAKDVPLSEITLRKYEKPAKLKERELVKKVCLAVGLLQPGDSRDVVVDVLHVLLKGMKRKRAFNCSEIEKRVIQNRKMHKLPMLGVAPSNVRRQIKRLRSLFFIEKVKTTYRITEFSPLSETFEEKIERFLLHSTLQRVKEYLSAIDDKFA
ncbi:hypothetical protein JXB11_04320 [Candidatus Woesearchaeota archaeon]|nr:hypothetical protein [Candidatus Woesearchaeota archaeon]